MPSDAPTDPVRATLVAILQQLNRVEAMYEGRARDQALTLADLDRVLRKFPPIEDGQVKIGIALGLLVRNRLVEVEAPGGHPTRTRPPAPAHYRITAEGKQFLIEALAKTDRIA
jgi:hypothetical protein